MPILLPSFLTITKVELLSSVTVNYFFFLYVMFSLQQSSKHSISPQLPPYKKRLNQSNIFVIYLYSRVNILQFLQQPLILPAQHLLVPQQCVPHSEQLAVLRPQRGVLLHVQLYQLY